MHHQNRIRSSRGMHRFADEHSHQRNRLGQRVHPQRIAKDLKAGYACESANAMAAKKCPRLRRRRMRETKEKDR